MKKNIRIKLEYHRPLASHPDVFSGYIVQEISGAVTAFTFNRKEIRVGDRLTEEEAKDIGNTVTVVPCK